MHSCHNPSLRIIWFKLLGKPVHRAFGIQLSHLLCGGQGQRRPDPGDSELLGEAAWGRAQKAGSWSAGVWTSLSSMAQLMCWSRQQAVLCPAPSAAFWALLSPMGWARLLQSLLSTLGQRRASVKCSSEEQSRSQQKRGIPCCLPSLWVSDSAVCW